MPQLPLSCRLHVFLNASCSSTALCGWLLIKEAHAMPFHCSAPASCTGAWPQAKQRLYKAKDTALQHSLLRFAQERSHFLALPLCAQVGAQLQSKKTVCQDIRTQP
jgi:hypothetical protein